MVQQKTIIKKLWIVLFLSSISFSFSQEYYFNRLIQYQENDNNQIQLLYNSETFDFFLLLRDDESGVTADLYDQKAKRIHNFEVSKPLGHTGLSYGYTYSSSEKFIKSKVRNSLEYEFNRLRPENNYERLNLKVYDSRNKNGNLIDADLTLRKTHQSKFQEFNLCCLLGFDYLDLIHPSDNYVVIHAVVKDQTGKFFDYKLVSEQIVQFRLKVPEPKKR